jgi:16S rRNA (uracil1498-N3)-methyltransferase
MPSYRKPTRLYVDAPLEAGSLALDADQAHYLGRVLRCRVGDAIVVFNARGVERGAIIDSLGRQRPMLSLGESLPPLPEPAIPVVLLQALVKSDAMDLIVQKATELGADSIFAARTEFGVVRLDAERGERRLGHWQRIAVSACEQSGRHRPPALHIFASLDDAVAALPAGIEKIAFDVGSEMPIPDGNGASDSAGNGAGDLRAAAQAAGGVCIAIGPEGGFSSFEIDFLKSRAFTLYSLGPRILRAETAALAALACMQWLTGNLDADGC